MIRPFVSSDRFAILEMMRSFYHSPAVCHSVPESFFNTTIDTVLSGSPYAEGWLVEYDGQPAGYGLIAKTYSNEVGGLVVWLEELYISEIFRGLGLGSELIGFIENQYSGQAARFRLEVSDSNEGARRLYQKLGYERLPYEQMIKEQ